MIEARSLQFPGSLSPVCKINCVNQRKQTRTQKATNNPWFNELFYFMMTMSPAKLFDEIITIAV